MGDDCYAIMGINKPCKGGWTVYENIQNDFR